MKWILIILMVLAVVIPVPLGCYLHYKWEKIRMRNRGYYFKE